VNIHWTAGTCDFPLLLLDVRNMSVALTLVSHTRLGIEIVANHAVQCELESGNALWGGCICVRDIIGHCCCMRG
jgi:hypothetical protein